ncbi:MAG: polysaccharide biosynthesis/export family protein, partial [Verrucomicrobia bacterium]|nr:polysaccharide biosynthesis/export family protein [Verrucomicrobiota bacterium]
MNSDLVSQPRKGARKLRPLTIPFVIWGKWPSGSPILVFLFCAVLQSFCERVSGQNIRSRGEIYGTTSGVENTTSMEVLDDKRPLRVGDRLSMRVVEDRKPPTPLVVTDSGEVEVPLIGRVMAKGKTCKQLAYSIK